jgi:hypothetical protein
VTFVEGVRPTAAASLLKRETISWARSLGVVEDVMRYVPSPIRPSSDDPLA